MKKNNLTKTILVVAVLVALPWLAAQAEVREFAGIYMQNDEPGAVYARTNNAINLKIKGKKVKSHLDVGAGLESGYERLGFSIPVQNMRVGAAGGIVFNASKNADLFTPTAGFFIEFPGAKGIHVQADYDIQMNDTQNHFFRLKAVFELD